MPYVVFRGSLTAEDVWLAFRPMELQEDGATMKVTDCYLAQTKDHLLGRALVVERGFPKSFFLRLAQEDVGKGVYRLSLNLEKTGVPERTPATRRLMGLCAWYVLAAEPDLEIERTNIEDLIRGPRSE